MFIYRFNRYIYGILHNVHLYVALRTIDTHEHLKNQTISGVTSTTSKTLTSSTSAISTPIAVSMTEDDYVMNNDNQEYNNIIEDDNIIVVSDSDSSYDLIPESIQMIIDHYDEIHDSDDSQYQDD